MLKKILKYLVMLSIFSVSMLFTNGIVNAEKMVGLSPEDEKIQETLAKYTVNEGDSTSFDLDAAIQNQEDDIIIEIGMVINNISRDEKTSQNPYARATFLIYGNYCGYGNKGKGKMPTDNLDTACMYHDYCYVHGGNNKTCNTNFRNRLSAIMKVTKKTTYKYAVAAGAYAIFK